jgi:hypothetical protein
MAAITGAAIAAVGATAAIVGQAQAKKKAKQAEADAEAKLNEAKNQRQKVTDPTADLGVNTKEAEFENATTDQALANTLDTTKQAGFGAGSATALATAAAKSKQGIAASIGKQEADIQKMKVEGKTFVYNANETRTNMDLNRYSSLMSQYGQQANDANAAMWSSIGNTTGNIGSGLISAYGDGKKK